MLLPRLHQSQQRCYLLLLLCLTITLLITTTTFTSASPPVVDPDDAALMEIGVDLSHRVDPTPTYTTTRPADHEDTIIAKFPQLHEIAGVEQKDWADIQALLFREPSVAGESNIDMKLDELEKQFEKIDAKPIPSSIAPKGSTLLPKIVKPALSLNGVTAEKKKAAAAGQPRLQQLKSKTDAAAGTKANPAAAASGSAGGAASAAEKSKANAAKATPPAAAKSSTPAKPAAAKPSPAASKATSKKKKAVAESKVTATINTIREIDSRIQGLNGLVQKLKGQMGVSSLPKGKAGAKGGKPKSADDAIKQAIAAQKKEEKEQAQKKIERSMRFAELDSDAETETEESTENETEEDQDQQSLAETDAESDSENESESDSEADSENESEADNESESETESESDSAAELTADAEAVDEIIEALM